MFDKPLPLQFAPSDETQTPPGPKKEITAPTPSKHWPPCAISCIYSVCPECPGCPVQSVKLNMSSMCWLPPLKHGPPAKMLMAFALKTHDGLRPRIISFSFSFSLIVFHLERQERSARGEVSPGDRRPGSRYKYGCRYTHGSTQRWRMMSNVAEGPGCRMEKRADRGGKSHGQAIKHANTGP